MGIYATYSEVLKPLDKLVTVLNDCLYIVFIYCVISMTQEFHMQFHCLSVKF